MVLPETLIHQIRYTNIERFCTSNGKDIDVYTEGEMQMINHTEAIVIGDENIPDIWYDVTYACGMVFFSMFGLLPLLDEDGIPYADFIDAVCVDLLDYDIMLLDTEAEIFITRSWDVYRIPFRYLLRFGVKDDLYDAPEFLGNYAPSVEERIIGIVEIRGREYDIDRL